MDADKAQVVEMLRSRGDQELADRVNRELPARFDPADVDFLREVRPQVDASDAARHASDGHREDMTGLPESPT
jgi:hypothetical protein